MFAMRGFAGALTSVVTTLLVSVLSVCASAQDRTKDGERPDGGSSEGRRWAVVIGVDTYLDPEIAKLDFSVADAKLMAQRLSEKCGYEPHRILLIHDDHPKGHLRPLKFNLQTQVPKWLSQAAPEDTVLVFFSGHGFLNKKEEAFLAPADCRLDSLEESALPTEQLRGWLMECKAEKKLLVLDCCRSRTEKGNEAGPSSQELGLSFRVARGLITLASCMKGESSWEWPEKKQGLFTYFLVEGLSGAADRDRDGIVDSDELYSYTLEQVRPTGQLELNILQTPARFIPDGTIGKFDMAKVATPTAALVMAPAAVTAPAMTRVEARFTVREGDKDGPPVPGALIELMHRASDEADPAGLAMGRAGDDGVATLQVALAPDLKTAGEFLVRITAASKTYEFTLPKFPESTKWSLYVDRCSPLTAASGREFTNSIGMKLVRIEPGEFLMGSPDSEGGASDDEKPQHRVRITKPFYLGATEVTQGQYQAVMGVNPSSFNGSDSLPVEKVTWADAVSFCEKLTAKEGKGLRYRLPTEAEWEYVCRAGSATIYPWGNQAGPLGEYAWFTENSGGKTQPVGQKRSNAWGLYDMQGNVSEWCEDWYDEGYYATSPPGDPPGGAEASFRVFRGGSWGSSPGVCRPAYRNWSRPVYQIIALGFRLAAVQE